MSVMVGQFSVTPSTDSNVNSGKLYGKNFSSIVCETKAVMKVEEEHFHEKRSALRPKAVTAVS